MASRMPRAAYLERLALFSLILDFIFAILFYFLLVGFSGGYIVHIVVIFRYVLSVLLSSR